jgi:hypothetical protein
VIASESSAFPVASCHWFCSGAASRIYTSEPPPLSHCFPHRILSSL